MLNVKNFVSIDAAVAEAVSQGGGCVYLPAGAYHYSGPGIDVQGVPLLLEGDGPGLTRLYFQDVDAQQCIRLAGAPYPHDGGITVGGGIRDMTLECHAPGKDLLVVDQLFWWEIRNLVTWLGERSLVVRECSDGLVDHCHFAGYRSHGIQVYGNRYSACWYRDLQICCPTTDQAIGFEYAVDDNDPEGDAGGIDLSHVRVNHYGVAGYRFSSLAKRGLFVFADHCVADGDFYEGAWVLRNARVFRLTQPWGLNTYGAPAFVLDGVSDVTAIGGSAFASNPDWSPGATLLLSGGCGQVGFDARHVFGSPVTDGSPHEDVTLCGKPAPWDTPVINGALGRSGESMQQLLDALASFGWIDNQTK